MNQITLTGRLTESPVTKSTTTGKVLCNFSFATNEYIGGKTTVTYNNCQAWGKTAETINKHCTKGTKLLISGRLGDNNYTNKEGKKIYSKVIIVNNIEFIGEKSKDVGEGNSYDSSVNDMINTTFDDGPTLDITSEDLPF